MKFRALKLLKIFQSKIQFSDIRAFENIWMKYSILPTFKTSKIFIMKLNFLKIKLLKIFGEKDDKRKALELSKIFR